MLIKSENIYIKYLLRSLILYLLFLVWFFIFNSIENQKVILEIPIEPVWAGYILLLFIFWAFLWASIEKINNYFDENPEKHPTLKIIFGSVMLVLFLAGVWKFLYKIFQASDSIQQWFHMGTHGVIWITLLILITWFYLSGLWNKFFTKQWMADGSIWEVKITNSWNFKMTSRQRVYLNSELIHEQYIGWIEYTLDVLSWDPNSNISIVIDRSDGWTDVIEWYIQAKYSWLYVDCEIYLNWEKLKNMINLNH